MYTLRGRDLTDLRDGSEAAAAARAELHVAPGFFKESSQGLQDEEAGHTIGEVTPRGVSGKLADKIRVLQNAMSSESPAKTTPSAVGDSIGDFTVGTSAHASPAPASLLDTASPTKTAGLQETEMMLQAKAAYCSGRAHRKCCASRQCNPWRRGGNRSRGSSRQSNHGTADLPPAFGSSTAQESMAQDESEMISTLPSNLVTGMTGEAEATIIEALRKQNKELSERLQKKSQELVKVQERLHRYEQEIARLNKLQNEMFYPGYNRCTAPCCLPVARLEKAGLNAEPLSGLDATWAGYVFSLASVQVRSSGSTFTEIFRKHRNSMGKMDEAAFRDFIHQFFPNIYEDRLTRLFFFADSDGSGHLNFMEFLRIFACDLNGKMGEEYFEHVMVRVHRAIGKRGGLSSVLSLRNRDVQVDGSLNRQKMIDLLLDLKIGLNRREALDLTATFDPNGTGEVHIVEFTDAMNMCASACFVTEEWVHKLFDQVVTMIHTQSRSLHKALEPFAVKGSMNHDELSVFLRQFVPGLRDSQVDRVYTFLLSGNERLSSHKTGEIDLSHFFEVVCRPSLGPTAKGKADKSLPNEVTERLALQLDRLCGSLSAAFDMLNPCLFIEEFRASLLSLGFAPGMDFTQVFNLLDVHRNGRVQRTTFIQVLQRHVHRLQAVKQANQGKSHIFAETREEEARIESAAGCIGRFFRKRLTQTRCSIVKSANTLENRLQKQHTTLPVRTVGGAQMVPLSQHTEVLRDQQRAINRILVLENDLEYARRRLGQGMSGHQDRAQLEDLRSLESANHRLAARLREVRSKTRQRFARRRSPSPLQHDRVRSASAPPLLQRRAPALGFVEREEEEKEWQKARAQLKEAQEEIKILQLEKIALQEDMASKSLRLYKERRSVQESLAANVQEDTNAKEEEEGLEELEQADDDKEEDRRGSSPALRWSMLRSVSRPMTQKKTAPKPLPPPPLPSQTTSHTIAPPPLLPSQTTMHTFASAAHSALHSTMSNHAYQPPKDNCTAMMLTALVNYSSNNDVRLFLQTMIGYSINYRFTIRGVVTVESDSLVLRCTDDYLRREVAVKLPTVDDLGNRSRFLRECVIYSHLLDVTEVQDVYHFPGLCEDMVCCVMELLRGRLLSDHLQAIRKGEQDPLTTYEAAEICDALLYGISECHTRGVVHLDLKPSVVWEVKQPAKVVVKILDFGLAHLANRSLLTADARHLFEKRRSTEEEDEDVSLAPDSSADGPFEAVPPIMEHTKIWAEFSPYAILKNWGTPWYMSPPRWCSYVIRNQRSSVAIPDLRWDDVSAGQNLLIEHGVSDGLDTAHVGSINEHARTVQGSETVPQLPNGKYFEIIIRKVWPRHIMQTAEDRKNNWPGMAIGFTASPPPPAGKVLPDYAKRIPKSWVLGYGGRFFIDGCDAKIDDLAADEALTGFRRRQATTTAPSEVMGDLFMESEYDGPLGWSFGELYRGDRLGLMATDSGYLEVYVNSHMVSKLRVPSLENQMLLYPVVDLCGRFREVGLVPQPRSPSGDYRLDCFSEHRHQVERLARRTNMPCNDILAAGLIVQECFSSHLIPDVPLSFIHLLKAIQKWLLHDRPPVAESGDILKALYHWSKEDRLCKEVPTDIMEVLQRVFNGSRGDEPVPDDPANPSSHAIHHAHQFRVALNDKTSWCHMPPEFLKSHVKNEALERAAKDPFTARQHQRLGDKFLAITRQVISGGPPSNEDLWDLTPWTLSSSHVRRVVQVLHSGDGDHIGVVSIFRFEPNVPVELMLRLASCFRGFPDGDSSDDSSDSTSDAEGNHSPSNNKAQLTHRRSPRQLLFAGTPFPTKTCPVAFAKLEEANAVGLVLHFVREFDLFHGPSAQGFHAGSAQSPIGPEGASLLATALNRNEVLQQLGACGQGFGDVGVSALSTALHNGTNLRKLDLRSNGISDIGAKALSDTLRRPDCSLQSLNLTSNEIGSAGCRHLAVMLSENESLMFLNLQRNKIGDDGAMYIGDALHQNISLCELDIGRNCFGVAGAGKLARATRANSSLQTLNMQDNALDALVAVTLAEAFSVHHSPQKRSVKRLSQIHDVPPLLFPQGTMGSMLLRLNLRHNCLGSAGAAELLKSLRLNCRLAYLNLAWNDLAMEAAKAFAALFGAGSVSTLEDVDLRDNLLGEGAAIGLAFLTLGTPAGAPIREEDRTAGEPGKPGTHGSPSRRDSSRGSTCAGSSRFSRIAGLPLGRQRTQENMSISATSGTQRFQGLHDHTPRFSSTKGFRQSGFTKSTAGMCLRSLNLANCHLDARGIGLLAKAMPIFQSLEELYMYNNGLGAADHMAGHGHENAVRQEHEKFDSNHSDSKAVNFSEHARAQNVTERLPPSTSGAVANLVEFVSSLSPSLKKISLGSCMLGTSMGIALLDSLHGRLHLQEIDVSDNDFHENDLLLDSIRHFLKTGPSINKLGLALNSLGNGGASTVARVLAATPQEIVVDLAANHVSSEIRDAILHPGRLGETASSKEPTDGGKTLSQTLAEQLAAELHTAAYPMRGRLLI